MGRLSYSWPTGLSQYVKRRRIHFTKFSPQANVYTMYMIASKGFIIWQNKASLQQLFNKIILFSPKFLRILILFQPFLHIYVFFKRLKKS